MCLVFVVGCGLVNFGGGVGKVCMLFDVRVMGWVKLVCVWLGVIVLMFCVSEVVVSVSRMVVVRVWVMVMVV